MSKAKAVVEAESKRELLDIVRGDVAWVAIIGYPEEEMVYDNVYVSLDRERLCAHVLEVIRGWYAEDDELTARIEAQSNDPETLINLYMEQEGMRGVKFQIDKYRLV